MNTTSQIDAANWYTSTRGWGLNTTTSQVNGIRFLLEGSNITSGTFNLFGMLK